VRFTEKPRRLRRATVAFELRKKPVKNVLTLGTSAVKALRTWLKSLRHQSSAAQPGNLPPGDWVILRVPAALLGSRLAQPYWRRQTSEFEQPLDRALRQRIAAKPPHVTVNNARKRVRNSASNAGANGIVTSIKRVSA
jgi:hypothetical protein